MRINKENLTIIIVTIKSYKIIDKCLNSIDPDIKKIIVENSSNLNFINDLKNRYKNLEGYTTNDNLGMGKANNFGISKSTTRYVMILNPDTILDQNAMKNIYEISENLNFAILSPLSENIKFPNYKIKNENIYYENGLIEVDQVDGYSMILDKQKFNKKFFDEKIFMYLENDDLCLRAKNNNEKIFIYSKSLIKHSGANTVDQKYSNELELSRNWHWNWSKFYFKKKHYGFMSAFASSFHKPIKSIFKSIYFFLTFRPYKSKVYLNRALGFVNALLGKKSSYRPRLD
ncbi:glycosyltransferase [Pelagibacteraceae bacterium]|jgi:GT2 family glycosyltransferase|nr:glycosyltransferase [Pelagibacteraceae bacterium]